MKHQISEYLKNSVYGIVLKCARIYWRIVKPITFGARVLLIHNDQVLLVQPRRSFYWNFPGGGIDKGESPEVAAMRELYEETSIKITEVDYCLGVYNSKDEGKRDTIYIYVAKADSLAIPKLEIEIQKAEWFPLNQLPEKVSKPTRWRIEEYLAGKRNVQGVWSKQYHE